MVQGDPMILQPNISSIAAEFPQHAYSTITMVITISAAFVGIASLSVGQLAKKIHKKILLLVGTVLFTVGGTATSLAPSFALILVTRVVEGFGAGIVITTSMTLIPELFPDERESEQILGLNGVATAVWGSILGVTAGYLGVATWRYANLLYLIGFIILVFQLLALPGVKKGKDAYYDVKQSGRITSSAISVAVLAFLFAVISTMFMTSVANFVVESGLGDSSEAGIAVTAMTVGAFFIGFAFARLFSKLKSLTPIVSFICMAIGVALPLLVTTYPVVVAGTAIFGVGYGIYFPFINAEAIRISPSENCDANLSLINGCYYIGMFASSFLMAAVNRISGDSSAHFNYRFMVCAFAVFIVYYAVRAAAVRRASGKDMPGICAAEECVPDERNGAHHF